MNQELKKDVGFIPLLFAGDINVYSVARAFHEEYGIKSYVYGKFATGPCYGSSIIEYRSNDKADEQETFKKLVEDFASLNSDRKVLLIGCGDSYVELASRNKDELPENVIVPYIDNDFMNSLINKEKFYEMCEEAGVDYPDTYVHRREYGFDVKLPFEGPYIIKPSNGIEYWKHPFSGQKKVFKEDGYENVIGVLKDIYESGYDDSVIIQNFIPGDDSYMRVLTSYSDQNAKVRMMCLGHVLLEEHTPHGIGNHAVIITEKNEELMNSYKRLLESIGYKGFSNFDIKYDKRDGKYKVFEINTRQGRSNYYVTASGANVAKCFVDDFIEDGDMQFAKASDEKLWLVVPKRVAFKYVKDEECKNKMRRLINEKKVVNPLLYRKDRAVKRMLRTAKNIFSHFIKYKKYMGN